MNSSEKLETNIPTPEQQQLPKNPEGGFEIDDEQKFEQHRDKTLSDVESGASGIKGDGVARLERTSHSYDLPEEEIASIRQESQVDEKLKSNSDEIDQLTQSTAEQIKSVGKTPESEQAPETQEGNIEKERTIEGFQEKRGAILTNVLTSETVNSGLNLIPFAGGGKMIVESISGKELSGHKLSGKERIIHGAIGAGSLALDFTGIGEMSKAGVLAGRSVGLVEKVGAGLATKGAVRSARVFEKTAEFMVKHPDLTAKAELYADSKIRGVVTQIKDYQREARPVEEETQIDELVTESLPVSENNLGNNDLIGKSENVVQQEVPQDALPEEISSDKKEETEGNLEQKEQIELNEYLNGDVFEKFGLTKEAEEKILYETPEGKREALQRSLENTRDSIRAFFEVYSEQGITDKNSRDAEMDSTKDYKVKIQREDLFEALSSEANNVKEKNSVTLNMNWKGVMLMLRDGGFKTFKDLKPEQQAALYRIYANYNERRKDLEQELGFAEGTPVAYGCYANSEGDEAKLGGASQYGDFFIEIEPPDNVSYTEGDSFNGNDTLAGSRKRENTKTEYTQTKNRQILGGQVHVAKAIYNLEKGFVKKYGSGGMSTYIEAQIPDFKLDMIKSIKVPDENAKQNILRNLDKIPNGENWREKIKVV